MLGRRSTPQRDFPSYVDTPAGIITAEGVRFRTTVALLEDYAGAVLQREPVDVLVRRAGVWLRSAQTLALWVLPPTLFVLPALAAGVVSAATFLLWQVFAPALVNRPVASVFAIAERPIVQAILYVAALSVLGIRGELGAVGVGLAGFIAFRWQLIPLAARPLVRWAQDRLFSLPAPDQVLRAFVLQAAIRHGVEMPSLERLKPRWPFGG